MAQGMNGAWLALGVAGAVAAAGAALGRKGSQARTADHRKTIARIPIKGEANRFVEVVVYYGLGGINYFNYENEPRGFYMSATPIKIEKRQGYSTKSFMGFSGIKSLAMPAARYSDKAMQKAIKEAREKMPAFVEKVCAKNGIEVESGSMARRATKSWSSMTQAERERQERAFRRFKQQSQRSKSQERSRQEREPDWHRSWYDTSGELD